MGKSRALFVRSPQQNMLQVPSPPLQHGATTASKDQPETMNLNVTQKKCCCQLKMIHFLCVVIVVVWCLLSLPIVFYYLPQQEHEVETNITNSSRRGECSSAFPYPTTGGICQTALQDVLSSLNCDSMTVPLVLEDQESTANSYIFQLGLLGPSPECREAVVPFLCQFLFGLCDSSGVSLQPTSGQCEDLRDRVCRTEWSAALEFGVDLPDCESSFPSQQNSCPELVTGSGSGSDFIFIAAVPESSTAGPTAEQVTCREGFYLEPGSNYCLPSCHTWLQYPKADSITIDVVVFLSAFVGFCAAVAVIVISLLRRKRMFVYPSVYIVYMTFDLLVLAFFVMVTYFNRGPLYCSSENLLENILEHQGRVTPFCVISGMVFLYTLMQLTVWWLFHTTSVFWKVQFPFHARSFRGVKYIHISSIVAAILVPLVPIIAAVANSANSDSDVPFVERGLGFLVTRYPPILCTPSNIDVIFYAVVVPIDIVLAIGCSLLIIMFWTVHKQHGLFTNRDSAKNPLVKFGTAERKLLIVFCYYILLAVIALSAFTFSIRSFSASIRLVLEYFNCERNGHTTSNPCSRSEFEALNNAALTSFSYIILGLFPLVNLVYAVNIQELKVYCRCIRKKPTSKSGISNNENSTLSTGMNSSKV